MQPLTDNDYLLKKFPGKGGWTYAEIPEVLQNKDKPFGWVKVHGTIDDATIKCKLMPMGNGRLFLPVKAALRKQLQKEAGSYVHVILYEDNAPLVIPAEMHACLIDEPAAYHFFHSLTEGEQQQCIDRIYSAQNEITRINRIAETINLLAAGLKTHGKS